MEDDTIDFFCPLLTRSDKSKYDILPGIWFESSENEPKNKTLLYVPTLDADDNEVGHSCSATNFDCSAWGCENEPFHKENCQRLRPRVSLVSFHSSLDFIPYEAETITKERINTYLSSKMSFLRIRVNVTMEMGGGTFHCSNGSLLAPSQIAVWSSTSSVPSNPVVLKMPTTLGFVHGGVHQLWSRSIHVVHRDFRVGILTPKIGQDLRLYMKIHFRRIFKMRVSVTRLDGEQFKGVARKSHYTIYRRESLDIYCVFILPSKGYNL